jgi:hypothetical protein
MLKAKGSRGKRVGACALMLCICISLIYGITDNYAYASAAIDVNQEVEIIVSVSTEIVKQGSVSIIYDTNYFRYVPDSLSWIYSAETSKFDFNSNRVDTDLTALGVTELNGKTGAQVSFTLKGSKVTLSEDEYADIFSIKLKAVQPTTITESTFGTYSNRPSTYSIVGDGDPVPSTTSYTITPTSITTSTTVNNTSFDVDVTLTADPTTALYASVQAELTYDPKLVKPNLSALNGVVSEDEDALGKLTITIGPDKDAPVGDGVLLATIPFTPIAEGTAKFAVSDNATVSIQGNPPEIQAAPGTPLEVEIKAATLPVTVGGSYEGLPASGYQVIKFKLPDAPTKVYTYDGEPMHYAKIDGEHYIMYIVSDDVTSTSAKLPELTDIDYANDGDLNGGGLRISDAQIAYDLAKSHSSYTGDSDLTLLDIQARLKADVDGDGQITEADAAVIKSAVHGASLPFAPAA